MRIICVIFCGEELVVLLLPKKKRRLCLHPIRQAGDTERERASPPRTRTQIILWSVRGKFEDLMCTVDLCVEKMRIQFQEPVDPTQFGQFVISKLWTLVWTVIIWTGSTYVNVLSPWHEPVMMADAFTPSQMLWKQSKVVLGVKALIKPFQRKWKPSAWKQSRVGALDLDLQVADDTRGTACVFCRS